MSDDADLRQAWARLADEPPRSPCPESGAIYDALAGTTPVAEREAVVDHIRVCGPCSEAWRMAMDVQASVVNAAAGSAPGAGAGVVVPGPARWWAAPLAAGLALAAALLFYVQPFSPAEDPWRAAASLGEVAAAVPNGSELPREAFTLSWTGGAADDRYIIRISDASLAKVHESEPRSGPTYTVPVEALAGVASGATLYWQVETLAASGDRTRSATFDVRLR
ncbi:hypothetical protein LBMAG42_09930 [Deltaproteobacteria bacterium]|nr:hypothetical protein LBMAG42_09930 [Deltaproteobacteria bacterium]